MAGCRQTCRGDDESDAAAPKPGMRGPAPHTSEVRDSFADELIDSTPQGELFTASKGHCDAAPGDAPAAEESDEDGPEQRHMVLKRPSVIDMKVQQARMLTSACCAGMAPR